LGSGSVGGTSVPWVEIPRPAGLLLVCPFRASVFICFTYVAGIFRSCGIRGVHRVDMEHVPGVQRPKIWVMLRAPAWECLSSGLCPVFDSEVYFRERLS
jgi:hypothetical protein